MPSRFTVRNLLPLPALLVAIVLLAGPAGAADTAPCRADPAFGILDFWLGARRAVTGEGELFGWERLPSVATVIVEEMFLAADDGAYYYTDDPLERVGWDTVRPGDLIVIEDHVGVLYEDRGPGGGGDGVLNRWDRALEAYFEPLRETALGEAFVSGITVYRLPSSEVAASSEGGR